MSSINNVLAGTTLAHSSNFTSGRTSSISYIVVHYTANDGDTAKGNCSYFSGSSRNASAHYFVDETSIYRSVEDSNTAWHCGATSYKHSSCRNANSIGIEMCSRKDSAGKYYIKDEVVTKTIQLVKLLMQKYNIKSDNVLRHYDVTGKSCPEPFVRTSSLWGNFKGLLSGGSALSQSISSSPSTASTQSQSQDKIIWDFFKSKGLSDFAIAGLMGNLFAESALSPTNLQDTFEKSLNMSDSVYTSSIDSGSYSNFINDSAGYGLAQWTYSTRKQALLNFAKQKGVSIGNLSMQLEFLWQELQSYPTVIKVFSSATTIKEVSDVVLLDFEKPAVQSEAVKLKRLEYSSSYYNTFSSSGSCPYLVQVTTSPLNIRSGASTSFSIVGSIQDKGKYTIIEEANNWGKLKSGVGWISLAYTKKI
ncbi:MAG: phage tail tip lysozyme [bacterium]